jgi:DNA repair exonuclease SbcCD ATPase subunit
MFKAKQHNHERAAGSPVAESSAPPSPQAEGALATLRAEARDRERDAALDARLDALTRAEEAARERYERETLRWTRETTDARERLVQAGEELAAVRAEAEQHAVTAKSLAEEREEMARQLSDAREALATAAAEAERDSEDRRRLEDRVEELERERDSAQDEIERTAAELARVRGEAEDAANAAEEQRRARTEVEERMERVQAEVEDRAAVLAEAERQLDSALRRRMDSFLESEREARAADERDRREAAARAAELAGLEARIVQAREVLIELSAETKREHDRHAALDDRLRDIIGVEPEPAEPDVHEPQPEPERGDQEHEPVTGNGRVTEAIQSTQPGRRRLFGRRKQGPFIGEPGYCSVCSRELIVETKGELAESGWLISDGEAVCVLCQEEGWELPDGAPLPLRRSAQRS